MEKMPQFNNKPEQRPDPGLLAQGIEEKLEQLSKNPEIEKRIEIELRPEKPEEVFEVESLESPTEKQILLCPSCRQPLDASGKCQTRLCERFQETIMQPQAQPEQTKLIPSSSILTNEEMDELERLEEERDKRILAEREEARLAELSKRKLESQKVEAVGENLELAQIAKKIEPLKRDVESFIKNYPAFDSVIEGKKIDPSKLNEEETKEVLGRLSKDEMEKLVKHVASDIAPFYLSTLNANEKQLWIEGLRKFTSGAVKEVIDKVLKNYYN